MAAKPYIPTDEIEALVTESIEDLQEEILTQVLVIAEEGLAIARKEHLYEVQTNNLTSSTGFAVTRDGNTVSVSAFDKAPGHEGGDEGCAKGREYIDILLKEDAQKGCISLTMVAGMDYAGYVEEMGLDVLKSAARYIEKEIAELMKDYAQ